MFFEKIKNRIQTYQRYFLFQQQVQKKEKLVGDSSKKVFFNFKTIGTNPYQFALISSFSDAGYQIFLKDNAIWIGNLGNVAKLLSQLPNLELCSKVQDSKDFFYISDTISPFDQKIWKKMFFLNYDSFRANPEDYQKMLMMPYPMHPNNCGAAKHEKILHYRKHKAQMRIFFSGNQDKETYDKPIFSTFFKQLNRIEILKTIKSSLHKDEVFLITHNEDKILLDESYQNKFVLNEWGWSTKESSNIESRVRNENWLEQLSYADFFVGCPGVNQPLCHNIIEAMSVGTIPILEHFNHFSPPLEHQKNAIVFKGKDDLAEKVHEVLALPSDKVQEMKIQVIEYYEKYLAPKPFVQRLEGVDEYKSNLYIFAETVSHTFHK